MKMQIPGMGTLERDANGAWVLLDPAGVEKKIPAEYLPLLDDLDRWERQEAVLELATAKGSARVPRLWDGPLPGSRNHSDSRIKEVPLTSSVDFITLNTVGFLFLKSLFYHIEGALTGGFQAYTDDVIPCTILLNKSEHYRIKAMTGFIKLQVFLIIPPGEVIFRVSNTLGTSHYVNLGIEAWERIPPARK